MFLYQFFGSQSMKFCKKIVQTVMLEELGIRQSPRMRRHYVDGLWGRTAGHRRHVPRPGGRTRHTARLPVHHGVVQLLPGPAQRLALRLLLLRLLLDRRRRHRHRLSHLPGPWRSRDGARGVDVVDAIQVVLRSGPDLVVLVAVVDADVVFGVADRVQGHGGARLGAVHLPFFNLQN